MSSSDGTTSSTPLIKATEITSNDVLSGRGGAVNGHPGNAHFRTLCVDRKPDFDEGSSAVKRRVATEIVDAVGSSDPPGRFLRPAAAVPSARAARKDGGGSKTAAGAAIAKGGLPPGPWIELPREKSIQKATQVMRDHERPDRVDDDRQAVAAAKRKIASASASSSKKTSSPAKKKAKTTSKKQQKRLLADMTVEAFRAVGCTNGIIPTDTDILGGRGGFVNGHPGNKYLRVLAMERKDAFDAADQNGKKSIASEVVKLIEGQEPVGGRFLKRIVKAATEPAGAKAKTNDDDNEDEDDRAFGFQGPWEVMDEGDARHKALQVMRDLKRDRIQEKERAAAAKLLKEKEVPKLKGAKKTTTKKKVTKGKGRKGGRKKSTDEEDDINEAVAEAVAAAEMAEAETAAGLDRDMTINIGDDDAPVHTAQI